MSDATALFTRIQRRRNRHHNMPVPIRLPYWSKTTLLENMGSCGFTVGAEIGVREGNGALELHRHMPGLHLLCIDPWDAWPGHEDMGRLDDPLEFLAEAKQRLAGYDCEFICSKSADYAKSVADGSLDFVKIDGDHTFDGTMLDLILWSPKVHRGGIVLGHNYKHFRRNGVVPAVDAYSREHLIHEWYITNNDRDPTWFWLKQ